MTDIWWLMGVLMTTIADSSNLPELMSANGDGVVSLANLVNSYANGGETDQDVGP